MKRALVVTVCAGLTASVSAQQATWQAAGGQTFDVAVHAPGRASVALETRVTKGQPYSGDAITEFVQVLADGNRIVRRTGTRLYRDGEGRTRREIGASAGGELKSIAITDPVGGFSLVLDPATHTATRTNATVTRFTGATFVGGKATMDPEGRVSVRLRTADGEVDAATKRDIEKALSAAGGVEVKRALGDQPMAWTSVEGGRVMAYGPTEVMRLAGDAEKENLGERIIEGVRAEGTRTTTVIPAGSIGNEQPLTTISEQWFSPELEVLVMTRHSDPRVGETTYRLTNIVRAEPDKSLFQLPSDYVLKELLLPRRPE